VADDDTLVALVAGGRLDEARRHALAVLDQPAALKPARTSAQASGSVR
jgi:hypothetical protein